MATSTDNIEQLANQDYKYGFVTDIDAEAVPPGLNEEIIRIISAKKGEPEWLLEWRLNAFRVWQTMVEPQWHNVHFPPVDFQDIIYYSAPKQKPKLESLDDLDPEIKATFDKLGVPIEEQKVMAGGGGRRGVRLGVGRDHLQGQAGRSRHRLLLVLRGGAGPSGPGPEVPRLGGAGPPTTSTPRSTRRSSPTARSPTSRRA